MNNRIIASRPSHFLYISTS